MQAQALAAAAAAAARAAAAACGQISLTPFTTFPLFLLLPRDKVKGERGRRAARGASRGGSRCEPRTSGGLNARCHPSLRSQPVPRMPCN